MRMVSVLLGTGDRAISINGKIKNNKPADMPANMPESMPANMNAGNAENIRENLWLYRVYNGLSRYEMADGYKAWAVSIL